MSKYPEMPDWLKAKLDENVGFYYQDDIEFKDGYEKGFDLCFEILWPQVEVLEKKLLQCKMQRNYLLMKAHDNKFLSDAYALDFDLFEKAIEAITND